MSNIFLPVFHNLQLTSTYHVSHPSLGLLNWLTPCLVSFS
jgi:hypothetical protein